MKHPMWSTIIVAGFGLVIALIAGFGPRLMPNAVSLGFRSGRYGFSTAPGPTIQVDRPKDTGKKFMVRLGVGALTCVLVGLASHKEIIRKFEEDFTPW